MVDPTTGQEEELIRDGGRVKEKGRRFCCFVTYVIKRKKERRDREIDKAWAFESHSKRYHTF